MINKGAAARADAMDWAAFIKANTALMTPPLVPEIRLHLAVESLPIWHKTEEQLGEEGVPPPYWAFAWAGGQALARYLLDTPEIVLGKRVVDIGAGSGLSAIAAMMAGAGHVLAADIDAVATEAMRINASANGVIIDVITEDLLSQSMSDCEVLLIGDLYYERPLAERVTQFAAHHAAAGVIVLAGDPRRSYFPADRFEMMMQYEVPVTRELEDSEIKRTSVWRFVR